MPQNIYIYCDLIYCPHFKEVLFPAPWRWRDKSEKRRNMQQLCTR